MIESIISHFKEHLPVSWEPEKDQVETLSQLINFSISNNYIIGSNYNEAFVEAVNQKLALNSAAYQDILDAAFSDKVKLNYTAKNQIHSLLDCGDQNGFHNYLLSLNIESSRMEAAFSPISKNETFHALSTMIEHDPKHLMVLSSIFSRYCFNLFEHRCTATFFSGDTHFTEDFFDYVDYLYPDMCKRDKALAYIDISKELFSNGYSSGCNTILQTIKNAYFELNNHCDLAIFIPPLVFGKTDFQWELYCDLVLFADKFVEERLDRTYFRWKKILETTSSYIPDLDVEKARFDIAFQGFTYKDCFVLGDSSGPAPYSLLLIFEKNVRDERPLNCPACRTSHIQGNSYPILNVRSWECENPLCPDRSKYNRGKRYAFSSVLRQKLMQDESNLIPQSIISTWHLDCVYDLTQYDAIEMCLRHYSCVNDGIIVYTLDQEKFDSQDCLGRTFHFFPFAAPTSDLQNDFLSSAYFSRYFIKDFKSPLPFESCNIGNATIFCGDSFSVLRSIKDNSISCSVTSPPYYNAKEYSQWDNIYCYLYDMYNISLELFRVLKPGGIYLFNIFDYFDNEKDIVLSAMGNRRMILGAYMLDIFRRIGFTIKGNIIWNKGEIQGNRSFNQGNLTPYYQAPLNCWEHIFILSKGESDPKFDTLFSRIEEIKPVIKMIRGKNILGHTAPYPKDIPGLLIRCLNSSDTILDPFLGSGTTAIVANNYGIHSVGIEKNAEYYSLSKRLIDNEFPDQLSLFVN